MKRNVFLLLLFFGIGVLFAQSSSHSNVAVLSFQGDENVTDKQIAFITSKFSGELIALNRFNVLERNKMDFILQEQGFQQSGACNSSDCQLQMGQLLGVDYLITGNLVRFGNTYALHLDFVDVGTGQIRHAVDVEQKGDLESVYKQLCQSAAQQLDWVVHVRVDKTTGEPTQISAGVMPPTPFQWTPRRKWAMILGGAALGSAGVGVYYNQKGNTYADDYESAILNQNVADTRSAFDHTEEADFKRNVGYGVSLSMAVVGLALWLWPEGP